MGRDAKRVARQDNRRLRSVGGGCATRLTRFCAGHVEKCACNERLAQHTQTPRVMQSSGRAAGEGTASSDERWREAATAIKKLSRSWW